MADLAFIGQVWDLLTELQNENIFIISKDAHSDRLFANNETKVFKFPKMQDNLRRLFPGYLD